MGRHELTRKLQPPTVIHRWSRRPLKPGPTASQTAGEAQFSLAASFPDRDDEPLALSRPVSLEVDGRSPCAGARGAERPRRPRPREPSSPLVGEPELPRERCGGLRGMGPALMNQALASGINPSDGSMNRAVVLPLLEKYGKGL
jgi:hypothetical protein